MRDRQRLATTRVLDIARRAKPERPIVTLRFFTSSAVAPPSELGTYSPSPVSLRAAGPRALALVSDFTRFDPPELDSPESDHGVASCYEPLREYAWLQVLISRFKPIAHLVVTAQARAARSLELNLGVV
jgi:hypothetical protein